MNSLDKMEDYDRLAEALINEKAENMELRREVAMLRKELILCAGAISSTSFWGLRESVGAAIDNTQATAEAYERDIAAKEVALVKLAALELAEEWGGYVVEDNAPHTNKVFIELHLNERIDELRAANKVKGA